MATTNGNLNGRNGQSSSALCSISEFLSTTFDYLIIGGGTAGLCIAARLTENPSVTVGVLEAGESRMDDPQVLTPSLFVTLPGRKEYDWMMETIPQASEHTSYSMREGELKISLTVTPPSPQQEIKSTPSPVGNFSAARVQSIT